MHKQGKVTFEADATLVPLIQYILNHYPYQAFTLASCEGDEGHYVINFAYIMLVVRELSTLDNIIEEIFDDADVITTVEYSKDTLSRSFTIRWDQSFNKQLIEYVEILSN